MLRSLILLLACFITLAVNAQQVPSAVNKWLNAELEKGKNKKLLKDYNSAAFFSTDSSRIVGYIKGYDTTLKFTSGIIYMGNVVTREDYPTVVTVHPDGRFEADLKMMHPLRTMINFKDNWLGVYIEPGQVVSMVFDWQLMVKKGEDHPEFIKTISFGGPVAQINRELNSVELEKYDYKKLQEQIETLTPDSFKVVQQKDWDNARRKLEAQLSGGKYLEHTKTILRDHMDLAYAIGFFDFMMYREARQKKDTAAAKASPAFYDFLVKNNFDRQELLLSRDFSTFINRLEFSEPYREGVTKRWVSGGKGDTAIVKAKLPPHVERLMKDWRAVDSILSGKYGINAVFLSGLCKARSLKNAFERAYLFKEKKDDARIYLTELANEIKHPFLLKESEALFHRKFSSAGKAYTLPDTRSAAIFKGLIDRHKGKMLFVDFWATSCGPCIGNIKAQRDLRSKYKNNPDFDFVFITSEDESPLQAYDKFIVEQSLQNTYRIKPDDYLALRELFKFNGIPRYVLIDKEGKVLDDDFEMYQFKEELPKLFPGKEWK